MNKKKKFSKEWDLKDAKYGGFILRLTESRVDIETKSKDWKVMFAANTYEYAFIVNALKHDDTQSIHLCAIAIFSTRMVFRDASLVKDIFDLAEKSAKNIVEKQPVTQSDEEILAEEKVLHEQTLESVNELEEIKKNDTDE